MLRHQLSEAIAQRCAVRKSGKPRRRRVYPAVPADDCVLQISLGYNGVLRAPCDGCVPQRLPFKVQEQSAEILVEITANPGRSLPVWAQGPVSRVAGFCQP